MCKMRYKTMYLLKTQENKVLKRELDSKTYNEKYLKARVRELEEHLSPTN